MANGKTVLNIVVVCSRRKTSTLMRAEELADQKDASSFAPPTSSASKALPRMHTGLTQLENAIHTAKLAATKIESIHLFP
jgi:hypothetical protein